jgi:hypothetical protein
LGKEEHLKRILWKYVELGLVLFVVLSSGLALYWIWTGDSFDPVREIERLRNENRRDDALDLAKVFRGSQTEDDHELEELEENLNYTTGEKAKSFLWNGVIKGEVYDSYSGLGAISADLCVLGDVRDLGIQSWNYVTDSEDFDRFIMLLSAAGVGLSSTGLVNGCNALAKNTAKYLKSIPGVAKKGMLRRLLETKLTYKESEKVWNLLKKTNGRSPGPHPAYPALTTPSIWTQHCNSLDVMEAPAMSLSA